MKRVVTAERKYQLRSVKGPKKMLLQYFSWVSYSRTKTLHIDRFKANRPWKVLVG